MNTLLCFAFALCATMALTTAFPAVEDVAVGVPLQDPLEAVPEEGLETAESRHRHGWGGHHGGWGHGGHGGHGGWGRRGGWGHGGGYGHGGGWGYGGGFGGGYGGGWGYGR